MTAQVEALVDGVRAVLAGAADADKAEPMRAYMKSSMPFLGVPAGPRKMLCGQIFREFRLDNQNEWADAVLGLWREASFREERYAAIHLSGLKKYDRFRTPDCLSMLEEMIVTGAWWDYVDEIAVRQIGGLLDRFPAEITPILLQWSSGDNMWKRRTSIISQVLRKDRTDPNLLRTASLASIDSKEFFLRKAIGWALRAYASTDPAFVRAFVAEFSSRLSGLSSREALRRIGPK